jgi:hypothetical protein
MVPIEIFLKITEDFMDNRKMNNSKYGLHFLFGLPVLITSVTPSFYDKEKIIDTITSNYKKEKIRDSWGLNSGSFFKTDIHHSHGDESSEKFKKINYDKLIPCYHKPIENYVSLLTDKSFNYKFEIVNYSAVTHNSFMKPHAHPNCDFSMVHYVSFDKEQHLPTIFLNPYFFSGYINNEDKLKKIFYNNVSITSSWLFEEWTHDIEEDDVIIFPSVLKHYVRNIDSEKLRVTIATNITIEETEKKNAV